MNTSIVELSREHPTLTVSVGITELMEMARFCVSETKKSLEQIIQDESQEKYLSPAKTAELLAVNATTLWRWNNKNYLSPVKIGGKSRYRLSDINKILKKG
ncbi:MAG: helix-turn-helix domain-containing protein [Bacteroidales bacterium]|nr:helix-turn-helix domain-containing protein [Bacteroidales bacterium]